MTADESERHLILEMIASGKITASEGLRLLKALGEVEEPEADDELSGLLPESGTEVNAFIDHGNSLPPGEASQSAAREAAPETETLPGEAPDMGRSSPLSSAQRWRSFWMIPLWTGVAVTVLGSWLLYAVQQRTGINFWFFCASLPFLLGLLLLVIAWQTRTAPWLHLRIQQKEGEWPQRIALSFPIPLGITTWFLRTFKGRISGMDNISPDELLTALGKGTSPENPIYIQVDEGDDGEKVEIYIG